MEREGGEALINEPIPEDLATPFSLVHLEGRMGRERGEGSSILFLFPIFFLFFSPPFFFFSRLPSLTRLAILASREKLFDYSRMFDVPGIVETWSIDRF